MCRGIGAGRSSHLRRCGVFFVYRLGGGGLSGGFIEYLDLCRGGGELI